MKTSEYWSQYWQQGNITSFGDKLTNGYEGVLSDEWENVFKKLNVNENVIDLCTGNISLIRQAQKSIKLFSQVSFVGVDYADIVSDNFIENNDNVTLIDGVNIEKLPCDDSSFEQVISNFGIEYSDLGKSIPEVSRVLKVRGRADLVCHHQSSDLIKASRKELVFISDLLKENGAIDKLQALITALDARYVTQKAGPIRDELNLVMSSLLDKYGSSLYSSEFMAFFKYIFNKGTVDKLSKMDQYKKEILGYKYRIESMVNAALSEECIMNIKTLLMNVNLILVDEYILKEDNNIVGYKISLEKI